MEFKQIKGLWYYKSGDRWIYLQTEVYEYITELIDQKEHYMKCNRCGDYFDMRNLSKIAVHEECERMVPYKEGSKLK